MRDQGEKEMVRVNYTYFSWRWLAVGLVLVAAGLLANTQVQLIAWRFLLGTGLFAIGVWVIASAWREGVVETRYDLLFGGWRNFVYDRTRLTGRHQLIVIVVAVIAYLLIQQAL